MNNKEKIMDIKFIKKFENIIVRIFDNNFLLKEKYFTDVLDAICLINNYKDENDINIFNKDDNILLFEGTVYSFITQIKDHLKKYHKNI